MTKPDTPSYPSPDTRRFSKASPPDPLYSNNLPIIIACAIYVIIVLFSLLDEWLDLPHRLLGGEITPINVPELVIELTVFTIIFAVGLVLLLWARQIHSRLQKELISTNRRLMDMIDFLPDPTMIIDEHQRLIGWNRAMEELTGLSQQTMLGKGDYEYALPFYRRRRPVLMDTFFQDPLFKEDAYEDLEQRPPYIVAESDIVTPDNKRRRVWIKASPMLDEHGRLTGAIESIRDITTAREDAIELQNRRRELQAVLDIAPVLISFKDLQGRIRLANQALAEALDIPREELIGKTAHDLFDKDLADRITRTDRTVLHSGMPGFEILPDFPFKHGPRRIRAHKVPFLDSEDRITGIVEVASDISELQQAQDQLQQAYKDLETRVEMRTQELRRIVQAMTGREMRIHELKDITEALSAQLRDAGLTPCVEDPLAASDHPHEEAASHE